MNKKLKFVFDKTKNVQHGNKTFFEHLYNTSKIIQQYFSEHQYLIDAGLYHAIYGTCYFEFDSNIDRDHIKKIIGNDAENLVYFYSKIDNRIENILSHKFESKMQKDLYIIEYANLLEQINELDDISFKHLKTIQQRLKYYYNLNMSLEPCKNNLYVFDGKLSRSQLNYLHTYCLQSNYKFQQISDMLSTERDNRLVCHLSKKEFENTLVIPSIQEIVNEIGVTLYLREFYINHYSQISYVNRHTDSFLSGSVTILIFCNKYWDETWGGELKLYDDINTSVNKIVDFVPGRIVVFDSEIEHKVLPLTPFAKSDRFSLAIKAFTDPTNITTLDFNSIIELKVAKIDILN